MDNIPTSIAEQMQTAISNESWKKLDSDSLYYLNILAQGYQKKTSYSLIFLSAPQKSKQGYRIWQKINELEELHLIWIKRNNRDIESIEVHAELQKRLQNEYPDLYVAPFEPDIRMDSIEITFPSNEVSDWYSQSKGTKSFKLYNTVIIPKDVDINYTYTVNNDGSVTLRIEPHYPDESKMTFRELGDGADKLIYK